MHKEGTASQRFLFSAENEKNTENQLNCEIKQGKMRYQIGGFRADYLY